MRRPWTLRLAGLPLGCPTAALALRVPTAAFGSGRTERLVDALDDLAPVRRTTDPRALPALLDREPDPGRGPSCGPPRVHAAIGQLELAVVGSQRCRGPRC